jgi:uncharacterized protein (TIGR02268 family)
MLQPVTPVWALLLLLVVTAAEAQPARGRQVSIAIRPGEPLPEVWVAAGHTTFIMLDAPVDKASVQLDTQRVRLVDVGASTLVLEPLVTPGQKERWVLRVRYAEGAWPEWAAFALGAHPGGEVDLQVRAVRPRQPLESCQEQLAAAQARCEGGRAEMWVLADRLGGKAVQAKPVQAHNAKGTAYRLGDGVLLVVKPKKEAGPPWVPTGAVLRSLAAPNEQVKARAVHVREGPPGEWGEVAVEAALPSPAAGLLFDLELRGESGQNLTVRDVMLPPAEGEKKESGR